MSVEDFLMWVHTRWEADPRSAREKLSLAALGLIGESGEVSEPIKKWLYSGKTIVREKLVEELGDTLHYWVELCAVFGIEPEEVTRYNVRKLKERLPNGHAPVPTDTAFPVLA